MSRLKLIGRGRMDFLPGRDSTDDEGEPMNSEIMSVALGGGTCLEEPDGESIKTGTTSVAEIRKSVLARASPSTPTVPRALRDLR